MAPRSGILPFYARYINGAPILLGKKTLRIVQKYILLLALITLGAVCTCTLLYIRMFPDQSRRRDTDSGGLFTFQPFTRNNKGLHFDKEQLLPSGVGEELLHDTNGEVKLLSKRERMLEQEKLNESLNEEIRRDKNNKREIDQIISNIKVEKERIVNQLRDESERKKLQQALRVNLDHSGHPGARGGEPLDPDVKAKRDKVKEMMLHAWHGYEQYGWGANEHRPVSKMQFLGSIFGGSSLGATIVDSVDTLFIMELDDEYRKARDWIAQNLSFDVSADLSVFETNIRFVGGLLSAYALTGDQVFKNSARDIANRLLPAFNTPTGLPFPSVDVKTGSSNNYGWVFDGSSILAEVGSLHLEFDYLSTVTGDSIYRDKVMKIRSFLKNIEKPNGLYSNFIHPITGKWGQQHVSIGALGDSFYEYLLKEWLISNREDTEARQMYDDAMKAVYENMLVKSKGGLTYFAELKFGRLEHKMDHLACFSAGMVGMGAAGSGNEEKYLNISEELAHTCHESYVRTATGLGPESFQFEGSTEAIALHQSEKYYILRPEVLESWYYLWRLTKKQKYRDWAWEMVQALETNCRAEGGYSGIKDVYQKNPQKDDVQQSFFLAETLKYLYLIFSESSLLPLDKWVFNTEAHPLPVKDVNPAVHQ